MIRTVAYLGVLALATPAFAQEAQPGTQPAPAAGATDMSKHGPWTRPVKNPDKKGVDQLFKTMEEAWKKGDVNAVAEHIDFPVIMLTDDSKGEVKQTLASREQWLSMMKSMDMNMPKDQMPKMSHKHNVTFLSDTLAVAIEDTKMSGKMKGNWKSMSVLTKRDGQWKVKQMTQAGWGDMQMPTDTAAEKGRQPTNVLPPIPTR
jgi:ketosteroid isomerase-like protein